MIVLIENIIFILILSRNKLVTRLFLRIKILNKKECDISITFILYIIDLTSDSFRAR